MNHFLLAQQEFVGQLTYVPLRKLFRPSHAHIRTPGETLSRKVKDFLLAQQEVCSTGFDVSENETFSSFVGSKNTICSRESDASEIETFSPLWPLHESGRSFPLLLGEQSCWRPREGTDSFLEAGPESQLPSFRLRPGSSVSYLDLRS